ncbi:MAG: DUF4446 family protein [Lachnospiraceae bacterium]|nr:DUF4446 family protein [Lachnospiraceae bacterium]
MNETILGMKPATVIYLLLILVALLIITTIFVINKMNIISRKYYALMSGKKGADLEKVIRVRFKEMDQVKANAKRVTKEHKQIKKQLSSSYSKMGLIKYDAFDQVAGKLSFVLALLNDDNTGVTLNAMHNRDGCYIYAKEIIKGESYIPLSEEEKQAIEKAKTVDEEINDLTSEAEDDISFDL